MIRNINRMTSLRSLVFEQQIAPIQKENSSFQQNQNSGFFSFSFDSQDIEEELPEKVPLIETLFKPQETSQKESFDEISKEKNPLQELLKQKKFFFVAHSLNSAHGNRISFQDIKPFARQSSMYVLIDYPSALM